MTLLALLIGLLYPACARPGIEGLPAPAPIDPAAIVRPRSPNTALAAPAGFRPVPDLVVPAYDLPAPALYRALREVAAHQPRTTLQAAYDDRLQAQFVVRSAVLNFPDLVMVQALPAGTAGTTPFPGAAGATPSPGAAGATPSLGAAGATPSLGAAGARLPAGPPGAPPLAGALPAGALPAGALPAGAAGPTPPAGSAPPIGGGSTLVVWSRSVYGWSDLGANRKRVASWLAALAALPAIAQAGSPASGPTGSGMAPAAAAGTHPAPQPGGQPAPDPTPRRAP